MGIDQESYARKKEILLHISLNSNYFIKLSIIKITHLVNDNIFHAGMCLSQCVFLSFFTVHSR